MLPRNNRAQLSRLAVSLQSEETGRKFSRLSANAVVKAEFIPSDSLDSVAPPARRPGKRVKRGYQATFRSAMRERLAKWSMWVVGDRLVPNPGA
jgi:hypothetical protein